MGLHPVSQSSTLLTSSFAGYGFRRAKSPDLARYIFMVGGSLNRGFTLLEVLTAMVIMGVVMALAAPRFREWLSHESVRQARVHVTTQLAGARSIAVQRGCESVLHVDAVASRVWVTACKLAGPGKDTVGIIDNLSSRYGAVFSSTGDSILFTPQGIAFSAAWITMTFSKEGYDQILEISPLGRPQW